MGQDGSHEAMAQGGFFETVRAVCEDYADTIHQSPRDTIVPPRARPDTAQRDAVDVFRRLFVDTAGELGARLELAETIGTGGVGVVREATQTALGRTVAVKMLRRNKLTDASITDLLSEAWITGSLEHPNIVPVYDLTVGEDGSPLIVLKRIEGVAWSQLMRDAGRVREKFGAENLSDWNLTILMQVLNAIRFAHSRGIVHRDIKPDNVMIGEFGEVYVVDWGLAVTVREDPTDRLPRARDVKNLAGTPCYMAPEMLGEGEGPITERTDVYLAGSVLYEILTEGPPHVGATALAVIGSVAASAPEFPADTPDELADICRRAMALDPANRFDSAEAMRLALQRYVQRRGSNELADRAEDTLTRLLEALDAPADDEAAHREQVYRLYGACRFGFAEALSAWPDNPAARRGMKQVSELMIEYELDQGNPRAAAALCAFLRAPPAELKHRIDRALAARVEEAARVAELKAFRRKLDIRAGQRFRLIGSLVLFIGFIAVPVLGTGGIGEATYRTHGRIMTWNSVFLALVLGVGYWQRRGFRDSVINRRLYGLLLTLMAAHIPLQLSLWMSDFTPRQSVHVHVFLWSFTAVVATVLLDRRLWPSAIAYFATFAIMSAGLSWVLYAIYASHLVFACNAVVVWGDLGTAAKSEQPDAGAD